MLLHSSIALAPLTPFRMNLVEAYLKLGDCYRPCNSAVSTTCVDVINERRRTYRAENRERPANPAALAPAETMAEEQCKTNAEHKSGRGDGLEFFG